MILEVLPKSYPFNQYATHHEKNTRTHYLYGLDSVATFQ
jgi:hypothetical protein